MLCGVIGMDSELELRKFVAPEFVFGVGALELAGRYAKNLSGRKVLLVTDPGVQATGWSDRAVESLSGMGIEYAVFQDVTSNPKVSEVQAGAEFYRSEGCDMIVAVGGGSPMDCAKAIGIVASNGGCIESFEGVDQVGRAIPPLICIPTTAGSSADVSQFAIIADERRRTKMAIVSKAVVPDVALIDPMTLTTKPQTLVACTGMDALTHAIEAYVSTAHSPITDLHALDAVRRIVKHLPDAVANPSNLVHQGPMMLASLEAGLAFSNAILGAVHAMAHSLGGYYDLAHGECNAILLSAVIRHNYSACPERYDKISAAMGLELYGYNSVERMNYLVGTISNLREKVGIAADLKHLGVQAADIPCLAGHALRDACLATNPRRMERREIEEIYGSII